jgi:hypothetical protein
MKTKFFSFILLALIAAFPFRYAYLDGQKPGIFSVLCMVVVVVGTLILMLVNMSDGKNKTE